MKQSMKRNRIELRKRSNDLSGYQVDVWNEHGLPGGSCVTEARSIDDHFVLVEDVFIQTTFAKVTPYGVVHNLEEADRRLYEKAKETAESFAKDYGIHDLVDLTKYAPESLPRGGK